MCLYFELTLWKPSGFLVCCLPPGEKRTTVYSPQIRHGRPTSETVVLKPDELTGVTHKSMNERFLRGANTTFQAAAAVKSLGLRQLIGQLAGSSAQDSSHCLQPIHARIASSPQREPWESCFMSFLSLKKLPHFFKSQCFLSWSL